MTKKRKSGWMKFLIHILSIALAFVMGVFIVRGTMMVLYPIRYADFVEPYALEYKIDKTLLYAVIETESGFDKDAVSSMGAMGLTQILPDTFTWLQSKTGEHLDSSALFDPETSIKYAAVFYGILMEKYDDVETAAAAYHAGMGCVGDWLEDERYSIDGKTLDSIPYKSTQEYVKKIVKAKTVYEKLY